MLSNNVACCDCKSTWNISNIVGCSFLFAILCLALLNGFGSSSNTKNSFCVSSAAMAVLAEPPNPSRITPPVDQMFELV